MDIWTFTLAVAMSGTASAMDPPADPSLPGEAAPATTELDRIVVTGQKADRSLDDQNKALDEDRDQVLLPKLGATQYRIDADALDALPLGANTSIDKAMLQAPGVSYDAAMSYPGFHVRNEYASVQYRINGIQLPDSVAGLGPILDTEFIGSLSLLDGTLPAQYGLRTGGVIDITTKSASDAGGVVDLYGGSYGTVSPHVEYGGSSGQTEYFVTARYLSSQEGLENALPSANPIHDQTTQERFFGYASTVIGDTNRLTYMAGAFVGHYQIPDVVGQMPLGDFRPATVSSSRLDENETDRFFFAQVALQTHRDNVDTQASLFTRYTSLDFLPDIDGDLAFNNIASNVVRRSVLSGLQVDASDRVSAAHVLRAGLYLTSEETHVGDVATVLPLNAQGDPVPSPETINDAMSKVGSGAGTYVQDEWTLSRTLTLNTGLRFDEMRQFVSAHQVSPRVVLVYKPLDGTSLHAGVSRYFTPPIQAEATPNDLARFRNTVQAPSIPLDDPVRPERATYADVGLDQELAPGLNAGADVYYKRSTDTIDDGQFGQAVVMDQLNYGRGFSRGAEFKMQYAEDGIRAYVNFSAEETKVKGVVSNQYLIGDPVELAYLANNYTYAPDAQTLTASFGASDRWHDMLFSIDGIYGSGLRAGFANELHSPGYVQWNGAIARDFYPGSSDKPLTLRLSVINLFDHSYLLRAATGIGEFAPQYGPRRGVFAEISQRL